MGLGILHSRIFLFAVPLLCGFKFPFPGIRFIKVADKFSDIVKMRHVLSPKQSWKGLASNPICVIR